MMPTRRPLLTVWGEALDPDHPLPEYPRPQLRRDSYLNLNGRWDHAFRISAREPSTWDGPIVVPFSPEAPLSGVGRQLQPAEFLHYRRTFDLPERFVRDRVLLHFGAVDQFCRVRVNGVDVGAHGGGYLPFTLDITEALKPGSNTLHVVVTDPSDTGTGARGKQKLQPGGIWYTAQSGIWQTVWLESVPAGHVTDVHLEPDLTGFTITVAATVTTTVDVSVLSGGVPVSTASGRTGSRLRIDIPQPRLWSPEDPHLYDVEIHCGDDEVRSYVGLRTTTVGPDASGVPQLLLNGRPYLHAGVLDQGYWSDGLYTAASDDALVFDIETMKDMGFTMMRKHIKIEPQRWYYHCDRLGMLVWQDMVNGGGPYRRGVVQVPAVTPLRLKDSHYRVFSRQDAAGRDQWLAETDQTVALLRNHPSVVVWVPFNEGWGQFDATLVAEQRPRPRPQPAGGPCQRLARPGWRGLPQPARLLPGLPGAPAQRPAGAGAQRVRRIQPARGRALPQRHRVRIPALHIGGVTGRGIPSAAHRPDPPRRHAGPDGHRVHPGQRRRGRDQRAADLRPPGGEDPGRAGAVGDRATAAVTHCSGIITMTRALAHTDPAAVTRPCPPLP